MLLWFLCCLDLLRRYRLWLLSWWDNISWVVITIWVKTDNFDVWRQCLLGLLRWLLRWFLDLNRYFDFLLYLWLNIHFSFTYDFFFLRIILSLHLNFHCHRLHLSFHSYRLSGFTDFCMLLNNWLLQHLLFLYRCLDVHRLHFFTFF